MRLLALCILALALIPASSSAQARTALSGPTIQSVMAGISTSSALDSRRSASAKAPARPNMGRDVAFMAVGGAALIAGAIIDGDAGTIFMVGGAVLLLYGLYQYLQ